MNPIKYVDFASQDFEDLYEMSQKLWTDFKKNELRKLLIESIPLRKNKILMAKSSDGKNIGFSFYSIRNDYVEGAEKSPTGYLEGIYVEPEFRKNGIAKEFLRLGELWCKEQGCTQLGSDTWLSDKESRNFHKNLGFWEEDELVHFLKNIQ